MANKTIEERMAAMEDQNQDKRRGGLRLPMVGGGLALVGALGAYFLAANVQSQTQTPLDTSKVEDFQSGPTTGDRLTLARPEPEQRVEEAIIRIENALETPAPAPRTPAPNAELAAELAAMRQALAESTAGRDKAISDAVTGLKEAFEDRAAELEDAAIKAERNLTALKASAKARENTLQSLIDAERGQREALEAAIAHDDLMALDAQRAEQAARDTAELEQLQIQSPAVIYAASQSGTAASGAPSIGDGNQRTLSGDEAFLRAPPALIVQEAEQMLDPDRTLAQG